MCQDLSRCASQQVPVNPHMQQGTASAPQLSRDLGPKPSLQTHPHIKFWNRNDWNKWIGQPENYTAGKTSFLEGEDGEQLDTKTVSLIRDSMRLAWNDLATQKRAPFTWGRATASVHDYFHSYMEDKWPILRLCNNGWKLDELASVTYPGYKRSYLDDKGSLKVKVKTEETDLDDVVGDLDHPSNENSSDTKKTQNTSQKRKAPKQAQPEVPSKRKKGKVTAPELANIESESSKLVTENSNQNTDANNATLSEQDTISDSTNDLGLSWDFSIKPGPTHPATVNNSNEVTPTVNGEDMNATATIDSKDNVVSFSDPGNEKVDSSTETSPGNNTTPRTVPSNVSKEDVTSDNDNDVDKVSSTVNSDQNPSATNENIKELMGNDDNNTSGDKIPEGGRKKSSRKERPKLTQKKSVRLILKNPTSVESLSEAKVDMPKLPELPTVTPSSKLTQSDKNSEQESKKRQTKGRMRIPSEKNGRNLCARRWLKQVNKDGPGTKDEFEEYWWTLTKEQRTAYDTEAQSIVCTLVLKEYIVLISLIASRKRVVEVGPYKWKVILITSAMSKSPLQRTPSPTYIMSIVSPFTTFDPEPIAFNSEMSKSSFFIAPFCHLAVCFRPRAHCFRLGAWSIPSRRLLPVV
ncbi:hypothetical protein J3R82DRAFT_6573 [Butyriboletus roseoflavus]|nr:hypothetical protein J3R82DRAFT_6573 [Butyriboletus roseoflavus]